MEELSDDEFERQSRSFSLKKVERDFYNEGYKEGIEIGKEETLQAGFNEGFVAGAKAAYAQGEVSGVLRYPRLTLYTFMLICVFSALISFVTGLPEDYEDALVQLRAFKKRVDSTSLPVDELREIKSSVNETCATVGLSTFFPVGEQ